MASTHPPVPAHERVLARVTKPQGEGGCWLSGHKIGRGGYGRVKVGTTQATVHERPAHAVVYEALIGPVPAGLQLDHQCHNEDPTCPGGECPHRRCVNPAHLRPVTARQNLMASGRTPAAVNASKTQCPRGHAYAAGTRRCPCRP